MYFYQDDTDSSGVPDTDAGVHLIMKAGKNQSEKAATAISSTDYFIVLGAEASVIEKTANTAEARIELAPYQGLFYARPSFATDSGSNQGTNGLPYFIIPKNYDVRLVAVSQNANKEMTGSIYGLLAKVVG